MKFLYPFILCLTLNLYALSAFAQQAQFTLKGAKFDPDGAVTITSDTLSVSETEGMAIFEGNAKIIQGEIIFTSQRLQVTYNQETSEIQQLEAKGEVRFSNGVEEIDADHALYKEGIENLIMRGNVRVEQERFTITSDELDLNLATNDIDVSGNVKTQFKSNN